MGTQSTAVTIAQDPTPDPTAATSAAVEDGRIAGAPPVAIVLTEAGELLEISTAQIADPRVITVLSAPQKAWRTPDLAPDGSTAWVGVDDRILRVDVATGAVEEAGEGMEPRLSPDGTRLAYTSGQFCANTLHVMDLDTGAALSWEKPIDGADFFRCLESLSWSPDGSLVAYSLGWESTSEVFLLDPSDPSATLDGRRLRGQNDSSTQWHRPMFVAGSNLVTVQEFVPADVDGGYAPGDVLLVDPRTQARSVAPEGADHHLVAAYGPAGDHALVISTWPGGVGDLLHRGPQGDVVLLATGVLGADW